MSKKAERNLESIVLVIWVIGFALSSELLNSIGLLILVGITLYNWKDEIIKLYHKISHRTK